MMRQMRREYEPLRSDTIDWNLPPRSPTNRSPRASLLASSGLSSTWGQPFHEKGQFQATASVMEEQAHTSRWVIVPEKGSMASLCVRAWDDLIICVLGVEAFWAPIVIAFPQFFDIRYAYFSRAQDILLTLDIILNFIVAVPKSGVDSGSRNIWERNPSAIAYHYIVPSKSAASGFFFWDMLAVLPGWREVFIKGKFVVEKLHGAAALCSFLLRSTRFVRLLRSMRGLHFTKSVDHYRVELGMPHWFTDMLCLAVILILSCHIAACTFILFEGKVSKSWFSWTDEFENSWLLAVLNRGDPCLHEAIDNPLCVYTLAFYWAAATLTTVGYGDVTPQNQVEYIVSSLIMVAFGFVWAFIVGSTVRLMSTVDPIGTTFKQETDDVNSMMDRMNLSHGLRVKMRRYLVERKHISYDYQERSLLRTAFPESLQSRVAAESPVCQFLLRHVFWAKDLSRDTLLKLVMSMQPHFYPPAERFNTRGTVVVIWSGLAAAKGKVLTRGEVYGFLDILLTSPALMEDHRMRALTYVDVLTFTKETLRYVLEEDQVADQRLRRAQVRVAAFRGFVRAGKARKNGFPTADVDTSTQPQRLWTACLDPLGGALEPPLLGAQKSSVSSQKDLTMSGSLKEIKEEMLRLEHYVARSFDALSSSPTRLPSSGVA